MSFCHRRVQTVTAALALCLLTLLHPAGARAQTPVKYTYWILAEGAANDFFDEDIVIGNPNPGPDPAAVKITLLPEGGPPVVIPTFSVLPTSRHTFNVRSHLPGTGASVSAIVESTNGKPLVVERTMTWAFGQRRGGHNSPGILATAPTWYLAEGAVGFFNTFILITNPSTTDAAKVEVKYLTETSGTITQNLTLPPNGRRTIWVNDGLDLNDDGVKDAVMPEAFSTIVRTTNGVNIAVERAMYWNDFEGGHESAALTAPNKTWLFAEGNTGGQAGVFEWDTWLLLSNPQTTKADVTLTFFRQNGAPIVYKTTVDPLARRTLKVGAIDVDNDNKPDLPTASFSTKIESTQDIVAERAMYWTSNGIFYIEGHDAPGVNAEALKWAFAEGVEGSIDTTGIRYNSFFLVSNASSTALSLKATFVREDGKGLVKQFTVPPQSRFTIPTATYPELSHQRFSAFLESMNSVPFVSERAVYWGSGFYGGHASVGTPWDAAIGAPPVVDLTPVVTDISPNKGLTTGGTDVTITGANFIEPLSGPGSGTQVKFGNVNATSVQIISDTKLLATTPPMAQPGPVAVTLTNTGWTPTVVANGFTYNPAEPTLETDLTLAFGDSITRGTSSQFCDMGGTTMICSTTITGYPERLRASLRARYPKQTEIEVTNSGVPSECVSRAACVPANLSGGRRFLDLLPGPHDLAVILEGVNDVNGGFSITEIVNTLRLMIDSARSQGKKVILCSLTPVKAHENAPNESPDFWKTDPFRVASLNTAIDQLAAELQVPRINMFAAFGSGPGALDCNESGTCRGLLSPDGLHPNDAGYQRMADVIRDKIVELFEQH